MLIMLIYTIWNIYACLLMFQDKGYATKQQWRISEKVLLTTAFCFGGIGIWCGMNWFRHKTKHWYFKWGVPAVAIIQIIFIFLLILN